ELNPDSLIRTNPSFEEYKRESEEIFPGWAVRGDPGELYRANLKGAHQGQACLELEALAPSGRPSRFMRAVYREDLPVERGTVYKVSAWVRTAASLGAAGLEIEWIGAAGKPIGRAWSDLYAGDTAWTEIAFPCVAPDGAASLRLACVGLGAFGKAWFDDVQVLAAPPDDSVRPFRLKAKTAAAEFGARGSLALYSGDHRMLSGGELRLWTAGGRVVRQALALGEAGYPKRSAGAYGWKARLHDLAAGRGVDLSQDAVLAEKGVTLSYRLKVPKTLEAEQLQLVFVFAPGALSDGLSLRRRDKTVVEHAAFPQTDEITAVTLGGSEHPLALTFESPIVAAAAEEDGQMRLVLTWPPEILAGPATEIAFAVE
ncbi:MAG: hypothetical protein HZA54_11790, partial [Planctomycetes bacterium]|nr:hypothetical protein [Planctomycetota bacterium]